MTHLNCCNAHAIISKVMPIEPANANIISLKVVFDRKKPIILSTLYTDQSFKVNLRYAPQNPFKYY